MAKPATPASIMPATPQQVVATFNLATSQLVELLDSGKKGDTTAKRVDSVEDRLTSLETKLQGSVATTGDIGKGMDAVKADIKKDMDCVVKRLSVLEVEAKNQHDDRDEMVKELFDLGAHVDHVQELATSAFTTAAKCLSSIFTKLATDLEKVAKRGDGQKK